MSKFKVGDRVRRCPGSPRNEGVVTMVYPGPTGFEEIKVRFDSDYSCRDFAHRFELVTKETEIERLVRVANEGLEAGNALRKNHLGEYVTTSVGFHISRYTAVVKPLPKTPARDKQELAVSKGFKAGDRVAVYGTTARTKFDRLPYSTKHPYAYRRGKKATVVYVFNPQDELSVKFDDGGQVEAHPKQCRRLVKRGGK